MGCHPNPIDELHHFSRWLLHQPEMVPHSSPRWFVSRGVPQVIQDPPWLKNPPWVLVPWQHLAKAMKGYEIWWNPMVHHGLNQCFLMFSHSNSNQRRIKDQKPVKFMWLVSVPQVLNHCQIWTLSNFKTQVISESTLLTLQKNWGWKPCESSSLAQTEGPPDTLIWEKRVVVVGNIIKLYIYI